jgi:hypothetical protein
MKLKITSGVVSLLLGAATMYAQGARQPMNYDGHPGGVRIIEEGMPPVIVHATVEAERAARRARPVRNASTSNDLYYHGGVGGIGVEPSPKIYLVLWGSQWSSDPSGESPLLQSFFGSVGGSGWSNSNTQYCQGVSTGTYYCSGAGTAAGNNIVFAGVWSDTSAKAPTHPRQSQLAAEASRAAAHFGNTSATSNKSVQYVLAVLRVAQLDKLFVRQHCVHEPAVYHRRRRQLRRELQRPRCKGGCHHRRRA